MSEDFNDKTEEPTPKKLSDARKKGKVAKSQDLIVAIMLGTGIIGIAVFARYLFVRMTMLMGGLFQHLYEPYDSLPALIFWSRQGVRYVVMMVLPLFIAVILCAFLVNVLQVGIMVSFEPLVPKWKKLNIFDPSNYKRFFDMQVLMRAFFGVTKLVIISVVTFFIITYSVPELSRYMHASPYEVFLYISRIVLLIGLVVFIILLFLGIIDIIYQRWRFNKEMRMTKQEVKDERKQTEGDVHVKSRMRSMMQAFVMARMKSNIPKSDVVIANPVHYAIAIQYDSDTMAAPRCVGKGARRIALMIKDIANEHDVPIVENPALARALYRGVDVGDMIPPEFYHSIAEVLAYVYKLNEKLGKDGKILKRNRPVGV